MIWKYTFNVTKVLANKNKIIFSVCSIPQGERLVLIIAHFENLTGFKNMCGAIDGTYIKLVEKTTMKL